MPSGYTNRYWSGIVNRFRAPVVEEPTPVERPEEEYFMPERLNEAPETGDSPHSARDNNTASWDGDFRGATLGGEIRRRSEMRQVTQRPRPENVSPAQQEGLRGVQSRLGSLGDSGFDRFMARSQAAERAISENAAAASRTAWLNDPSNIFGNVSGSRVNAGPSVGSTPPPLQTNSQIYGEFDVGSDFGEPPSARRVGSNVINPTEDDEMLTVGRHFGQRPSYPTIQAHPMILGTHLAGVEIELENLPSVRNRFSYWEAKGDGSLRNNGAEFVCSSPWGGRDLYNAAIEIDTFLFNNSPDESWRCSTHVHIDSRDMTVQQVKFMILTYAMYERVLFRLSGWHRYKNNFCSSLGFAQDQIRTISSAWQYDNGDFFQTLVNNWDKYSAINFLPMSSFGSIEFRISEAKWRKGRLIRLVNRFLSLKEVAMSWQGTESELVEMLLETPVQKILRKGIPRSNDDFTVDLEFGYKLCGDIMHMNAMKSRNIQLLTPDMDDGTRTFAARMFSAGWDHIRRDINPRSDNHGVELPRSQPPQMTFGYLNQLHCIAENSRYTFDPDWFLPEQNRSQISRLYRAFREEVNGPQRSNEDMFQQSESDDEEVDSSEEW